MVDVAPPLRRNTVGAPVVSLRDDDLVERADRLAGEEPLEIRVGGPSREPRSVAVTMRTPGNDFELAAGFLYAEGVVRSREEIRDLRYCDFPPDEQHYNVVTVGLSRDFDLGALERNFYTTSSCGVCGKASLESLEVRCPPVPPGPIVARSAITRLPQGLREGQRLFEQTGGLHAAALFDASGRLESLREDVGRHNAVDKVLGKALLDGGLPNAGPILMVSGRASFEIVQKAAVAAIPIVCAVSAPSSLAVDAAQRFGMTLVGFLRDRGFNVYAGLERIDPRG